MINLSSSLIPRFSLEFHQNSLTIGLTLWVCARRPLGMEKIKRWLISKKLTWRLAHALFSDQLLSAKSRHALFSDQLSRPIKFWNVWWNQLIKKKKLYLVELNRVNTPKWAKILFKKLLNLESISIPLLDPIILTRVINAFHPTIILPWVESNVNQP